LCAKEIIPEDFHNYYASLPTKKEKDYVQMDSDEDDIDFE
jgi:hypothetical protein